MSLYLLEKNDKMLLHHLHLPTELTVCPLSLLPGPSPVNCSLLGIQ